MTSFLTAVYIMWYRQIKRFLRMKYRVITAIIQPLFWMVFFGLGWAGMFRGQISKSFFGGGFIAFLTPGVVMISVSTISFMSGVSVIWDKEFGFLKEVLVAPASRSAIIFGRALGDSTVAVMQGLIVLLLSIVFYPNLNVTFLPIALVSMILTALTLTSIGISIGSKMSSMEAFQLINTLIFMPTIFLSGAFIPLASMPNWMKTLTLINPLTYGVDATRNALTGVGFLPLTIDLLLLSIFSIFFLGLSALIFKRTTIG